MVGHDRAPQWASPRHGRTAVASLVEAVALSDDVDGKPLLRCTHWFIGFVEFEAQPSELSLRRTHVSRSGIASAAGAHTYVIALLKRPPRHPRIEWPQDSAGPAGGTRRSKLIRRSVVKDMAWTLMIMMENKDCGTLAGCASAPRDRRCPREHQHAREMPIRDDPARPEITNKSGY